MELTLKSADKLDALYDSVTQSYVANNPKSQANHQEALKYLPGGNTRSVLHYYPFPMSLETGQGCRVTSLDGHEYLDFVSEFSAALFGHSHPDIMAAVQNAVQTRGFNLGGPSVDEVTLARHIVNRFKSMDKVRFTNSGTEANTMALAMALAQTGRKKVLVFSGGYHGAFAHFGAAGQSALNLPHEFVVGRYNDTSYNQRYITEELAAILVEPMQGAGGMIPASKAFLEYLRHAATKTGAVLIYDEIITSRFHMGGMQEYHGVYPDMTTVGKYIAGGFPFGAFGGRADIMAALEPNGLFHSGTHNNNTFSMAAGVAASKVLTADGISRINRLGDKLRDGVNEIAARYRTDWLRATGFGSTVGIHYGGPCPTRVRDAFFFFMVSKSIYIGKRGFLSLNLMHEEKDVDSVVSVVEEFVQRMQ
ncbi:pyridoxal phosphate-dependent transferase [Aspergillus germanicus]